MITYLKDEQHYSELYDRLTIDQCKRWEKNCNTKSKDPKAQIGAIACQVAMYFMKGERYKEKAGTVGDWMDQDSAKDKRIADTIEPSGIRCLNCSSLMECGLRDFCRYNGEDERVLFFFDCPKCKKRRAYWEGGEEREREETVCPKCRASMEYINKRKGDIITTTFTCHGCGHNKTEKMDFSSKKDVIDSNFESDRKKYCLSEKDGTAYINAEAQLKHLSDIVKDRKENKEVIEAAGKLKQLTVVDLEKLLNPLIAKAGYIKFEFEKPKIEKDVIVEFSAQDNKQGRAQYDSVQDFKKVIKKSLDNTNWRLMTTGISYRLGFLNGRIRGVEGEENLRALVASRVKK